MDLWLALAKGVFLRFILAVTILGLLRHVVLSLAALWEATRRAPAQSLDLRQIFGETLAWLFPIRRLHRNRFGYSLASFLFHVGVLFTSLFLVNHIDILRDQFGFGWLAIPKGILDILTLVTIITGSTLLLYRIYASNSRQLSQGSDYGLLILILGIFGSGFLAGRPGNPIPYAWLMLFHTLNGAALLLMIPYTKIAHCVLFPLIRLGSAIGWRLAPQAGGKVVQRLHGPEGRQI